MNKNNLAIATITWARDEMEEDLLRQSLQQLAATGIKVFITDGGSGAAFLAFMRSFQNFAVSEATVKGVWAQASSSLSAAYQSGAPSIFYTEPDKLDFFRASLQGMVDAVQTDEQTGIVLAARSATGFATFPAFQQMTETTINNCIAEVTGKELDYTYGPFLMNRKMIPYLNNMKENTGWGWRPYAFIIAQRLLYGIKAIEGDFLCPVEQQADDPVERIYRMRQLSQNIQGIVLASGALLS